MPRLLPAILIGVAVIFDILIAISLPLVPDLKLYIVGIDFSQTTFGSTLLLFNGQVNSAGKTFLVQNLVQLQLGLWAACVKDNLGDTQCFPFSLGYTVTLTDTNNQDISIVKPALTSGLPVLALAGAVSLVAALTLTLPRYHLILAGAIASHAISMGFDIALFVGISQELPSIQNQFAVNVTAPLAIGQTSAVPGPGLFVSLASTVAVSIVILTIWAERKK